MGLTKIHLDFQMWQKNFVVNLFPVMLFVMLPGRDHLKKKERYYYLFIYLFFCFVSVTY